MQEFALPLLRLQWLRLAPASLLRLQWLLTGGAMRFAIRNNFFVMPGCKPQLLWYQTDTKPGASGSPVCDDD